VRVTQTPARTRLLKHAGLPSSPWRPRCPDGLDRARVRAASALPYTKAGPQHDVRSWRTMPPYCVSRKVYPDDPSPIRFRVPLWPAPTMVPLRRGAPASLEKPRDYLRNLTYLDAPGPVPARALPTTVRTTIPLPGSAPGPRNI